MLQAKFDILGVRDELNVKSKRQAWGEGGVAVMFSNKVWCRPKVSDAQRVTGA